MSFKSLIYDRTGIEGRSQNWPVFLLLVLLSILGYLLRDVNGTLAASIILMSAAGMYISLFKDWSWKEPEGKYIGEIILSGDTFILNKEEIKTSDIKALKLEIGYTKGYKHYHRHGYIIDSGTNSKLELTAKGIRRDCNFQIYSDAQVKDLKNVLEALYSKGIFVKEFYLGNRTYLLEELEYEEIQEFKRKYKLISF